VSFTGASLGRIARRNSPGSYKAPGLALSPLQQRSRCGR
jgi:hypothetical protein